MYPITSQYLFEGTNSRFCGKISENDVNKNTKRTQYEIENILKFPPTKENGVFVNDRVEKQTCSHNFSFSEIQIESNLPKKFSVKVQSDRLLAPQDNTIKNKFWIRNIRVADDIPGANVILEFHDDKLQIQVIKQVCNNDELLLWFSEEIINFMGIPFLKPANIQGQKCYVCHHCFRVYETPNPLKIHLARNCDRFDENFLWQRLQTELLSRNQHKLLIDSRNYEIMKSFHSAPMQMQAAVATSSRRFSAFQPVSTQCSSSPSPPRPTSMPIPSLSPTSNSSLNESALAAAAHLETIVSNMGSSKQGHLCIYCGKLYSRKYGLKIHLRTHTGFKPLKCKFCYRPFGDPSNLNKHLRLHTQNNSIGSTDPMYKCNLCSKVLMRRRDLQRHIQLRHHPKNLHVIKNSNSQTHSSDSQMTLLSQSSSSENEDDEADQKR